MTNSIRISEIFGPTIQGEGALIGQPTVFVRTGGCDYRCSWCDTPFAVDSEFRKSWKSMSAEDIFTEVEKLSGGKPLMISLTGGNPAIHNMEPLIKLGKSKGYRFALETQGSIPQDWFSQIDVLTLSPKPPSSGMVTDWEKFDECLTAASLRAQRSNPDSCAQDSGLLRHSVPRNDVPEIALKIIVFDQTDYEFARDVAARYPQLPLYLQAGNHTPAAAKPDMDGIMARMRWLAGRVTNDQWFSAKILPQLHVMMWGNQRGV